MILEERLLFEAEQIASQLIANSKRSANTVHWDTISYENGEYKKRPDATIYSGVAGIALFFIYLYKVTRKQQYLDYSVLAVEWVYQTEIAKPSLRPSLYSGTLGCIYLLLQLVEVTGDTAYLERAINLFFSKRDFILDQPERESDILLGSSGVILGLLHLHKASNEDEIIKVIKILANRLLKTANCTRSGLAWGRSNDYMKELCGFGHGGSGIGYAFLEMGEYFSDSSCMWVAKQAFYYEDQFFSDKVMNWPDFRTGIDQSEQVKDRFKMEYERSNKRYFREINYGINAWCHGAAGIGLARLRGFDLLGRDEDFMQLSRALRKVEATFQDSSRYYWSDSLCHGTCGNAELFLTGYSTLSDERYYKMATEVAKNVILFHEKNGYYRSGFQKITGEDNSLFAGIAGVGYFLLRVLFYKDIPNILRPDVNSKAKKAERILEVDSETNRIDFVTLFQETSALIKETGLSLLFEKDLPEKLDFRDGLAIASQAVRALKSPLITNNFKLEQKKILLTQSVENWSYFYFRKNYIEEVQKTHKLVSSSCLMLDSFCKLSRSNKLATLEQEEVFLLLRCHYWGVEELEINEFSYLVLKEFAKPSVVAEVIENFEERYGIDTDSGDGEMKKIIKEQIEDAFYSNLLVVV